MKHCYSFFKRVTTLPSALRILFILLFTATANAIFAADIVLSLVAATKTTDATNDMYEWSGSWKQKDGITYVELPANVVKGTIAWKCGSAKSNRFLYIYTNAGSTKDESRSIVMAETYQTISFTNADIVTYNNAPHLHFATTDDFKGSGVLLTVPAEQSVSAYTITYETNGGNTIPDVTDATALIDPLPTPTKEGYAFAGWFTDAALTTPAVAGAAIAQNTTLYAKWNESGSETPSACTTSVWYFSVPSGETNSDRFDFGTSNPTGSNNMTNTMTIDGVTYTCTKRSSSYKKSFSFTVNTGKEATLYLCVLGDGSDRVLHIEKGTEVKKITINKEKNSDGTYKTFSVDGLTSGTWTVTCCKADGTSGQSYCLSMLGLHECQACTPPTAALQITPSSGSIKIGETTTISVNENTGNGGTVTYTVSPATGSVTADGVFSATVAGTYTITASQETNNGVCGGEATSTIEVKDSDPCETPKIATQPQGATYCSGETITPLSVSASVTDGGTLSYQWFLNGSPISDATSDSYTPTQAGKYQCQVTNTKQGYKSATVISAEAQIVINTVPTKVTIKGGVSELNVGESVTLTASTDGANPAYQWYKDNVALQGETNATYTYTASAEDAGKTITIRCQVTGCNNTPVASAAVTISVVNSACNYVTKKTTLSATEGYDFGDRVLYISNKDNKYGTSTSDICTPAKYRYYASVATVQLKTLGVSAIRFQGQQDYNVSVSKMEVSDALDGTYTELTGYTKIDYTGTSCGEVGVSGVNIPAGQFVRFTFAGGSDHEFRISGLCVEAQTCTTPSLSYSQSSVTVNWADVQSIAFPELNNPENLAVEYSSSNEQVATVDEEGNVSVVGAGTTTISADFAGDADKDFCSASAVYTLTVTCSDDVPMIVPSTGTVSCTTVTLSLVKSDGTTSVSEGKVQWYKNNAEILGATQYTYKAKTPGTYYATLEVNCLQQTSNEATITSDGGESPELSRLVNRHFFQIQNRELRPYNSETRYPLFRVKPVGQTADGKTYELKATIHRSNGDISPVVTPVDWVRRDAGNNGTDTLGADYVKLGAWIAAESATATGELQVGDSVFITVAPADACGEIDADIRDSVPVILTDKYSLGYIVTGTKGGNIMAVASGNLTDNLYTGLQLEYNVVPLNAYATYDYINYEPYDILLLTDYPKAKDKDTKPYVNALADLVDKKPVLSLKAHMASLDAWEKKGFDADPVVPGSGKKKNAQKTLTVLCFTHDIFGGATWDSEEDRTITILDNVYKDGKNYKGIQGFTALSTSNLMNIAMVYDSTGNRSLVACCERQEVVEARFAMLSVNQGATKYINAAGIKMIDLLLEYLLKTDENSVSDCALTFDNGDADGDGQVDADRIGAGDRQWGNKANWSSNSVPSQLHNVRIEANCEVSGNIYGVANVRINENYNLTIKPDGGLISTGKFSMYEKGKPKNITPISDTRHITVCADADHTGMLMHSHAEQLSATVQMYSPAYYDGTLPSGKPKRFWSYVGIPVRNISIPQCFRGAYTYVWNENNGWTRKGNGTTAHEWEGVGLSQPAPLVFTFAGELTAAEDKVLTLTNTGTDYKGMNIIGNSWTAPIQITKMKASDFGAGLEPTVYIYNTGRDPESGPATSADFTTAGQWMVIPVESAKQSGWQGPKVIPAMQAFDVNFLEGAAQTSATLTLDYDTLVRSAASDLNLYTQKLYKPRRNTNGGWEESTAEVLRPSTEEMVVNEPLMLRICLDNGTKKSDVYLLEDEQFGAGFDLGWDGYYQAGDDRAIGIYAMTPQGNMSVSAQDDLVGTTVAVSAKPEEDYLITFAWSGGEGETPALYLNDMQLRRSVLIDKDTWYTWRSAESDMINRFVISKTPLESTVGTGVAEIVNDGGAWAISNPAGEQITAYVYDAAGRLCERMQTADAILQLNIPSSQGVYMVHLHGTSTDKVVKIVR